MSLVKKIEHFEPGCISCENCGHKPEDAWDTDPEDFFACEGAWFCESCYDDILKRRT